MSDTNDNTTPGADAGTPADESGAGTPTYSPPTVTPPTVTPPSVAPPTWTPPAEPAQPQTTWTATPTPVTSDRHGYREMRRGGVLGGVILILVGLIFLANQFIPGIDIGRLWPLILIAIGIGIIFRRR